MSADIDCKPSLFARLKSGTEEQHRALERFINPFETFHSQESYKAYLWKYWTLYRSLEADLAPLDWRSIGIDFASRQKVYLLERDLCALGVPLPVVDKYNTLPDVVDLAFAVGCLYVLEGATLGGQIISRHLAKLEIGPDNGGLFFHGYGAQTGPMWKSFQIAASDFCATEALIDRAVLGAIWTFDLFHRSLTTLGNQI